MNKTFSTTNNIKNHLVKGKKPLVDSEIGFSHLEIAVVDVEVLDLDAHEYLVLQLWDVGVANVEVSDVALLLNNSMFNIKEIFILYSGPLII